MDKKTQIREGRFKKGGLNPAPKTERPAPPKPQHRTVPINSMSQNGRMSYTVNYSGIVVNANNQYHPEKMNLSMTRTVDYIEGESKADFEARLERMKSTEEILVDHVNSSLTEKVQRIKKALQG